jgi:hypothetical protein
MPPPQRTAADDAYLGEVVGMAVFLLRRFVECLQSDAQGALLLTTHLNGKAGDVEPQQAGYFGLCAAEHFTAFFVKYVSPNAKALPAVLPTVFRPATVAESDTQKDRYLALLAGVETLIDGGGGAAAFNGTPASMREMVEACQTAAMATRAQLVASKAVADADLQADLDVQRVAVHLELFSKGLSVFDGDLVKDLTRFEANAQKWMAANAS